MARAPVPPASAAPRRTLLDRLMATRATRRALRFGPIQRVLSPARGDRVIHTFIRYSMVSGVAIVISQAAILICTALFHSSGILANTIGAVMATPASYELNRKWAWGKHGKSHMFKEVAPFWALTLLGFLGSTGTVELADNMCRSHHVVGLTRSVAIMGASLFAYGVVWVAKFVIFHYVVFRSDSGSGPAPAGAMPPPATPASPANTPATAASPPAPAVPAPVQAATAAAPAATAPVQAATAAAPAATAATAAAPAATKATPAYGVARH
ncbi:MAG TPA: GtrA family protein [Acidimicrobiales bacterium]|nr:GtrA family protein [Acidimicrobiales bacterium]